MENNEIISNFDDLEDKSLTIKLEKNQDVVGCIICHLSGYIDTYNSNIFQKRIEKIVNAGFIYIIFDLTKLNYLSSTGIGSFVAVLKLIKPKSGDVVLFGIQQKVLEIFQLLGFNSFFKIKNNLEESISCFNQYNQDLIKKYSIFPMIFNCPICDKKLQTIKSGKFRCAKCKSIIQINENGDVLLG